MQEFAYRGLDILFLVPKGHIDKLDRLEWYQDSEEELVIAINSQERTPVCSCTCESSRKVFICILRLCVDFIPFRKNKTNVLEFLLQARCCFTQMYSVVTVCQF